MLQEICETHLVQLTRNAEAFLEGSTGRFDAEIQGCALESSTRAGYDESSMAPFNRAINVYADGVPR